MDRLTRLFVGVLLVFVMILAFPLNSLGMWVENGNSVCTAGNPQERPQLVSDGAGGAIITWQDGRSGNYDIYAQRVNASGVVQWGTNGVALCTATGDQLALGITSDGAGGVIVAWQDSRSGNYDIYAQRVNASGAVQWGSGLGPNGVALCTAGNPQERPQLVSDGAGGAIITWQDSRSGNYDIYARRVNASGVVQWATDGVALCTASGNQQWPTITSDGAGGAIVTWDDERDGSGPDDIYAQRVDASGVVQWNMNGVALCTASGSQWWPTITSDGAGGAVVTWQDSRSGGWDVYAQRVTASGVAQWGTNGLALCTATGDQRSLMITSDGAGGAIVTWQDGRSWNNSDIYAQRVDTVGVVQWGANGVALCTASGHQESPTITSDGASGAIVTWDDERSGSSHDIYAQRVDAVGVVQWGANGVALCTAIWEQWYPTVTSDGAGGAIVAWQDIRSGSSYDIYARQVDGRGRTGYLPPRIFSVRDVPGDQGGKVYLFWYAAPPDICMDSEMSQYTIWRAIAASNVTAACEAGAVVVSSVAELGTATSSPIIRVEEVSGTSYFWELVGTVDAYGLEGYGSSVTTLFDSTSVCRERHYFQVIAHTTDPHVFFVSDPDSGYSVDNLAPDPPSRVSGTCIPHVGLLLTWAPNSEQDLSHYAVYKGLDSTFIPSELTLIGTTTDTSFVDGSYNSPARVCYKLSAVDAHENESRWTMWAHEEGPTVIYSPELAAGVGERGIRITWNALPGATGYDLYERRETEEAYVQVTQTPILPGLSSYVYELSEYPEVTTYFMLSVLMPGGTQVRYGPVVVYPLRTAIVRCSPNPFSRSTQVQYSIASDAVGSLRVYDVAGRLVRTLHEGILARGTRSIVWDGSTDAGVRAAVGVYVVRFETGGLVESRKLVLIGG